jgi:pimeloyl-ACP methyl ester carboxylesterase
MPAAPPCAEVSSGSLVSRRSEPTLKFAQRSNERHPGARRRAAWLDRARSFWCTGFVDGSGWREVYRLLKEDGYGVGVVQNPTLSLEGDAAAPKRVVDAQNEPVILVGHSYGEAVITEAGNDPGVAALVFITAVAPDTGESVNILIGGFPKDALGRRPCRRRMDSCSSTGTGSTGRLRPTWIAAHELACARSSAVGRSDLGAGRE